MVVQKEVRVAVGSQGDRRSTVWKFVVHRSEVYIFTRMFGSDAKISLHSSGDCHCSATDSWVKKVSGRRNAERHKFRWSIPRPDGKTALLAFRVQIPETELRVIGEGEDVMSVQWLPTPPKGKTMSLECYITPISASDPVLSSSLPYPCLFSLPLADGHWFVILHHLVTLSGKDLEVLRTKMWEQARAAGIECRREQRGAVLTVKDGTNIRGLIELCPPAVEQSHAGDRC